MHVADDRSEAGQGRLDTVFFNLRMIRISLDDATREELRALRRGDVSPKVRDRIEMVALSDAGWSAPRIAAHLGVHPQTVRDLLRSFLARGLAALQPFRSGPAPDAERRERVVAALGRLLSQGRDWTSGQLSRALADEGIALGARQVRRYLEGMGAGARRGGSARRRGRPSGPDPAAAAPLAGDDRAAAPGGTPVRMGRPRPPRGGTG